MYFQTKQTKKLLFIVLLDYVLKRLELLLIYCPASEQTTYFGQLIKRKYQKFNIVFFYECLFPWTQNMFSPGINISVFHR